MKTSDTWLRLGCKYCKTCDWSVYKSSNNDNNMGRRNKKKKIAKVAATATTSGGGLSAAAVSCGSRKVKHSTNKVGVLFSYA